MRRTMKNIMRFRADTRGTIAVYFAIALIPLLLSVGAAIDYTRASMARRQLSAIADAAVLAALTPNMLSQSSSAAQTAVSTMFSSQAQNVAALIAGSGNLTVTVADKASVTGNVRTASLSYSASIRNAFGAIEGMSRTPVAVSATSTAGTAPNINFYLLLDSSASMEIPATTAGIAQMTANVGCAFACHEKNFADTDNLIKYPGWGSIDTYTYAKNNGIELRIDRVKLSASGLVSTAQNAMSSNGAAYQIGIYSFADGVQQIAALTPTTAANVSSIQSKIAALTPQLLATNGSLPQGAIFTYPTSSSAYTTKTLTADTFNSDAGTNFGYAMTYMNKIIPAPGGGTNATGDSPRAVLILVTDGVDDALLYNSSACGTSYAWTFSNAYGTFARCQQPMYAANCAALKAKGVAVAVLYTTYFPLTEAWYTSTVAPFMPQVPTNLQACASAANLYFEVQTDGDISAALQKIFMNAVSSVAHITN